MTLLQEQSAFDSMLPDLLKKHRDEYVVFFGGKPVAFFPDHESAYREAIARFGLDASFLIAPVREPIQQTISMAWDAGVMFG